MTDWWASLTAGETNAQAARNAGQPVSLATGTAVSNTNEDGTVQVLVDGPVGAGTDDPDAPNADAVIARCVAGYVAQDERVVLLVSGGTVYVVGSGGDGSEGQPRTLGAASIAPTSNIPVGVTSAVPITALTADAQVLHPGHLIEVNVNVHLTSNGANNTLTGRVIRQDSEGVNVEVGRFLRSSQMGNGETIQAGPTVFDFAPEPGPYVYFPTVQASVGGWTLILSPATSPLVVASLVVADLGPLPVGWAAS